METHTVTESVATAVALDLKNFLCVYTSMLTLLVYDWLILFDREVEYIWRGEWGVSKVLFIMVRYGGFIDTPIMITIMTLPYGAIDSDTCGTLYKIASWSGFVGFSISESILLLRTIAIYQKSKRVTVLLSTAYAIMIVAGIVIIWYHLHTVIIDTPSSPWSIGCYVDPGSRRVVLQSPYIFLLGFEFVVVILTIRRRFSDFYSGTPLLRVIYRDSFGFFLVLFILTLFVILFHFLAPPQFFGLLTVCIRVVHSTLSCRILLNLRQAASPRGSSTITGSISLVFATAPGSGTNQAETIQLEVHGVQSDDEGSSWQAEGDFVVGYSR